MVLKCKNTNFCENEIGKTWEKPPNILVLSTLWDKYFWPDELTFLFIILINTQLNAMFATFLLFQC